MAITTQALGLAKEETMSKKISLDVSFQCDNLELTRAEAIRLLCQLVEALGWTMKVIPTFEPKKTKR